jgi:hypothetical protein
MHYHHVLRPQVIKRFIMHAKKTAFIHPPAAIIEIFL